MADSGNPFISLFVSPEALQTAKETKERQLVELNSTICRIFLIKAAKTENHSNDPKYMLLVEQEGGLFTLENYEKALVERLQIKNPSQRLIAFSKGVQRSLYNKPYTVEDIPLSYLAHCYDRQQLEIVDNETQHWKIDALALIKYKIVQMAGIVICSTHRQNALLGKNSSESDFVTLFMKAVQGQQNLESYKRLKLILPFLYILYYESSVSLEFFKEIAQFQDSDNLVVIFNPLLSYIYEHSVELSLTSLHYNHMIDAVTFFCQVQPLANLIVDSIYWLPDDRVPQTGKSFQTYTLLGRLLSPTSLGPSLMQPSEHFKDIRFPIDRDQLNELIRSLQQCLEQNATKLHVMFSCLLRQGEKVKEKVIFWLVNCFTKNRDRCKVMFTRIQGAGPLLTTASDGFFLNLSWVLLLLSFPFTVHKEGAVNPRLMAIDPGYCTLGEEQYDKPYVDFSQETKMSTSSDGTSVELVKPTMPIKFVTHCFFLTHECLNLGLTQTIHFCKDILRMINRLSIERMTGNMPGIIEDERMLQRQYLGIQAHALDPQLLRLCLNFYASTTTWLVELVKEDFPDIFPLPTEVPIKLRNLPECLVENLCDFAMFLTQYNIQKLSANFDIFYELSELQQHLITFCTIFMSSSCLLSNPHLRAKLAQLLSLMIPDERKNHGLLQDSSQHIFFENHSIASQFLFKSLLTIFIDIEHTGDSMEFEDKFTYRIPMYAIIKFLWSIPVYQMSLVALSDEAQLIQTNSNTPLFLRFMNMIINDATLQLDEGLQNLSKIREIQLLKESPQWTVFTAEEKNDYESRLKEATMYAKNRNILALKTVNTLELITTKITKPFVIKAMVDQIAAMLNYFLKQLLGPKSKDLNVRDREKYNFDPRELICSIIGIYINLGREQEFCQAIPRDGRSFSMELFDQALSILKRLGKSDELCIGLIQMRESVYKCYQQLHIEEEMMDDAPEEFLDPLMNEIMSDPVILPTSGKVMERAVVMRHLLSDQTDPFNREPLTPDKLIPHEELRKKIDEWKLTKQQELNSK